MTAKIIRGTEVNRPEPDALSSSVLDHATVSVREGDFGLSNPEGQWPSYNCLDLLTPTAMCPEPMVGNKEFKRASWQPSFEFAVYGGVECSAVGLDTADQKAEVQRVFERSEGKGVEQALLYTRFETQVVAQGETPLWTAPEDVTPGTPVSLAVALSLLEGHAAANYVGVPTIHMPRGAVLMAFGLGLLSDVDGKFFTKTGAKVAAGGGYDDPAMLASGEWRLFATGEVVVEKSGLIEQQVFTIPGDKSADAGLGDNMVVSFAERMFRVTLDCYTAQITATIAAGTTAGGFGL